MTPPQLGFLPQFVPLIRRGDKHCTIRAPRKRGFKVDEPLYLYCGLRSKDAFRILPEPVLCTKVQTIEIRPWALIVDGAELTAPQCDRLARADGFKDFAAMVRYWMPLLPFRGHLIWWNPPKKRRPA